MRIVTQINDEDYIAFNNAYQFKSEEGRKRFTLYMVLFSIMQGMIIPIRCLGAEADTFLPYVQQRTGLGVIK